MATYYNPKITTNNIEFSADAANSKSWNGPIGTPYGYFCSGSPSPVYTSVDRIDYGSDTTALAPKGPLTVRRNYGAGASNINYGYIGGASPPNGTLDKIDYSNDTATAILIGGTIQSATHKGATGTSDYSWWVGGNPEFTYVERLDYSNDTADAVEKGSLVQGTGLMDSSFTNGSYGWFGGGYSPSASARLSLVQRIDFSNDTADSVEKGPLTNTRSSGIAGGASASYGYFMNGYNGGTRVDRVDFSNDTATASPKGPMDMGRRYTTSAPTSVYGYVGGGGTTDSTTVARMDFSNDTSTATAKGPLTAHRYAPIGTSSRVNQMPYLQKWKDMTGKGNDATIVNGDTATGPTFSGLDGGVWDFDGSNDYMEKTSFSGVAFGTGDFAVETWVRVDNLTADHMIFETRSAASSTEDGFVFFVYGSNNDEWSVWTAGASKITGANSSVAADTWYHTIVTRISGTTTLYVNGVSIGSFSDSYNYNNDDLRIGKNVTSANYLDGKIALFRVYKAKGLTASEVLNNFNATRTRFGV